MPFSVYDGIVAYSRAANMGLYLGSRTSIFNDPSRFKYDLKSNRILVRQIDAGAAGTYDPARGWMNGGYGNGRGVEWISYECPYDRAKTLTVDAVTEAQSYANGMESSINLLFNDFFQNHLPAEIDATNIAQWFSKVPSANIHTSTKQIGRLMRITFSTHSTTLRWKCLTVDITARQSFSCGRRFTKIS